MVVVSVDAYDPHDDHIRPSLPHPKTSQTQIDPHVGSSRLMTSQSQPQAGPSTSASLLFHPLTPISPNEQDDPTSPETYNRMLLDDESGQDAAGPSGASGSGQRRVPPPPQPRRHRSGILMSRMRAASGGIPRDRLATSSSQSFGDLQMMDTRAPGGQMVVSSDEEGPSGELAVPRAREFQRAVSEGNVGKDDGDTMWDNS